MIITPNSIDLKGRLLLVAGRVSIFFCGASCCRGADRINKGSRSVFIGHVRECTASELLDMVILIGYKLMETKYTAAARTKTNAVDVNPLIFVDHLGRIARDDRLLFSVYSIMERIVPSLRAQIGVVARKM